MVYGRMSKGFLCHVCEEASEDFKSALDHHIASHPAKPINVRRLYLNPSTGDFETAIVRFRVTPIEVWRQGRTVSAAKDNGPSTRLVIRVSSADHEANDGVTKRNSKFKSFTVIGIERPMEKKPEKPVQSISLQVNQKNGRYYVTPSQLKSMNIKDCQVVLNRIDEHCKLGLLSPERQTQDHNQNVVHQTPGVGNKEVESQIACKKMDVEDDDDDVYVTKHVQPRKESSSSVTSQTTAATACNTTVPPSASALQADAPGFALKLSDPLVSQTIWTPSIPGIVPVIPTQAPELTGDPPAIHIPIHPPIRPPSQQPPIIPIMNRVLMPPQNIRIQMFPPGSTQLRPVGNHGMGHNQPGPNNGLLQPNVAARFVLPRPPNITSSTSAQRNTSRSQPLMLNRSTSSKKKKVPTATLR